MAGETTTVLKQVETLFRAGSAAGLTDGQLLERFASGGASAEPAFAALVERHGGMVLRVCRQVLGDEHDAQDASQATFLVLARKARSISRRESVGSWLYGVALRVAGKARLAANRRRAHERRGGEMAAGRKGEAAEGFERWPELHEELGRLPESFRAPLVLCYLEGLTHEQAAEQLRWPLGTVESRLARGRAKLRARLARRGVTLSADLLAMASAPSASPAGWAEATVRAALRFSEVGRAAGAGTVPAAAALAEEVLRTMAYTKLKVAVGAILATAALVVSGAAVWARQDRKAPPPSTPKVADAKPKDKPQSEKPAPRFTPPADGAPVVVRGIIRDPQGVPIAKAWVGGDPRPMPDTWRGVRPEHIRERTEPYRDASGQVVPAGEVGKYFEVRGESGPWRPVHPDDIRPFDGQVFGGDGRAMTKEEIAKDHSPYEVRILRAGWWMSALPETREAVRTDAEGRFSIEFKLFGPTKLHFASPDYRLQATHTVKAEDVGQPLEVTLAPTRLVRARVVETPKDDPKAYLSWTVYHVDGASAIGAPWQEWMLPNPNAGDPPHVKRRLEVRLPEGRYKVEFRSPTVQKLVDFEVPAGEGPLDLPEVQLPALAHVAMVGKPAAEIEATGLDGKPVRLADYRGKVVVLDFWATWCGPCLGGMPRLIELQKRFKDQPFAILALHDGSVDSPDAYRKAAEPFRERFFGGGDLPFPVLIDRPPGETGRRPYSSAPGEKGSGRTCDLYEIYSWPSTFVIAKDGRLVGRFGEDALEGAIEEQLGLPRSRPAAPLASSRSEPPARRDVAVKGQVVGPDGKPVRGATVFPVMTRTGEGEIKTDGDGRFAFTAEGVSLAFDIKIEAPGLAAKVFQIDETGVIRLPLKLGVGVAVTGRVVRDGRPVAGAAMGLFQVERGPNYLGELEVKTDEQGRFRFPHAFADQDLWAFAPTGSLKDGGAVIPVKLKTGRDGTAVDLGDLEVRRSRILAGRVAFTDGKAVPPNVEVLASSENAGGLLRAKVDERGRFEVRGLPDGPVSACVLFRDHKQYRPPGYRLSAENKCRDPLNPWQIVGQLDRDVNDLHILFEPGEEPPSSSDPGQMADFKEARAGTIAGAAPK